MKGTFCAWISPVVTGKNQIFQVLFFSWNIPLKLNFQQLHFLADKNNPFYPLSPTFFPLLYLPPNCLKLICVCVGMTSSENFVNQLVVLMTTCQGKTFPCHST